MNGRMNAMSGIAKVRINKIAVEMVARLRRRRMQAGISQVELAFNVPMSRFKLNQAERGWISLRKDEIKTIEDTISALETKKHAQAESLEAGTAAAIA
jgi:ribosome-binding protein aMBF1 (putative translation factor)